jgi:hypothetical protein
MCACTLSPQVLSILTFGAKDGKGGFFPDGVAGRINLPTPLGPVYSSIRPGTRYAAYDNTGFADPRTSDEDLGKVPFLPSPPTVSEAPAPGTGIAPEKVFDAYLSGGKKGAEKAYPPSYEKRAEEKRAKNP